METAIFAFAITFFISLYSAFHYYVYRKLKPLLPRHRLLLITVLVLLGLSVFVVEIFTHGNIVTPLAEPVAFVSFGWMGIVFLFIAMSVSLDVLAWLVSISDYGKIHAHLISPTRTIVVGVMALVLAGYGYVASQQMHIEKLTLVSSKIITPLKIVQITDLHLGLISNEHYFQKMVDEINEMNVDVIVSTGDLVDMQMDHLDGLGEMMSSLRARYGKFAIFGNHEALAGLEASREFIKRIGFTLLLNDGVTIDNLVNLVGVDDPAMEGRVKQSSIDERALLQRYENGLYTVFLKHQPVVEKESIGLFDLQLSGHTHGGQIFPFGLLIHLFYEAPFGLSQYGGNGWLYVSRGTGTWGPPMRVLAPSEITLIQLQVP